jgi:hypothetical protein
MTATEYKRAYIRARGKWGSLIKSSLSEISKAYKLAANEIAKAILDADGLNADNLNLLSIQLQKSTGIIQERILEEIPASINNGQNLYNEIDETLLSELFAGSDKVTPNGIHKMINGINARLISVTVNRMYQDGYTLSNRVWQLSSDYQAQVTQLINSGLAQGLSIQDIAKSVQSYTIGGVERLAEDFPKAKWGNITIKNLDWRALRLIRSEFSASMKTGAVMAGEMNPASTKLYEWVRINTQQHDCECPGLAAGGPYTANSIPAQPHPNCMCQVRAILRDLKDFTADLKRWNSGEYVPEIDKWYNEYYLTAQNSA